MKDLVVAAAKMFGHELIIFDEPTENGVIGTYDDLKIMLSK